MEIKDIQDYVRHTPCNTNPAVLGSMIKELGNSGGGLPDPSMLSDGTAMVAVNGEWKMQEGYGWAEEGSVTTITWDGNTEGREAIYAEAEGQRLEMHYKVSDLTFTRDSVLGGKLTMNGVDYNIHDFNIVDNESDDYTSSTAQFTAVAIDALTVISCNTTGIIRFTDMGTTIEYHCPTTGIYFMSSASLGIDSYVSFLTYGTPDSVHQFDPALIPTNSGAMMVATVSTEDYGTYEIDKTFDEISSAVKNGTVVMVAMPSDGIYANLSQFMDNQSLQLAVFTSFGYSPRTGNAALTQFEIDGDNAITVRMLSIQAE